MRKKRKPAAPEETKPMSEIEKRKCDVCGKESPALPKFGQIGNVLDGWLHVSLHVDPLGVGDGCPTDGVNIIALDACSKECALAVLRKGMKAFESGETLRLETEERRLRRQQQEKPLAASSKPS
jgi:hypothetical protein